MAAEDRVVQYTGGSRESEKTLLKPWLKWRDASRADRKKYEREAMTNQHFAAGLQWLEYSAGQHRVRSLDKDKRGEALDVVNLLSQFNQTAIGKLAAGDLRPELLSQYADDQLAEQYAEQLNEALEF